jgi:hypothetical protein
MRASELGSAVAMRIVLKAMVAIILASATTPVTARDYALIVGISQYQSPNIKEQLRYADNDAESIENFLIDSKAYQEQCIVLLTNTAATQRAIENALRELDNRCAVKGGGDKALIFFAGHGVDAEAYLHKQSGSSMELLAPYDVEPSETFQVLSGGGGQENPTFITKDWLVTRLARLKASEVSVVLDSCDSGIPNFADLMGRVPTDESEVSGESVSAGSGGDRGLQRDPAVTLSSTSVAPAAVRRVALLAASSSDTSEYEFDQLSYGFQSDMERDRGHGALSFAILRSLYDERKGIPENEIRPLSVSRLYENVKRIFELTEVNGRPLQSYTHPEVAYFPSPAAGELLFARVRGQKKIVTASIVTSPGVAQPVPPSHPEAPPQPAPPSQPEPVGTIYFDTPLPPGSYVEINGDAAAPNPDGSITLPANRGYNVVVGVPDWHYRDVHYLRLAADERQELHFATEGELSVRSVDGNNPSQMGPPLNVFLDGQSVGSGTAFHLDRLRVGEHVVRATIANVDESTRIEIRPDSPLSLIYRVHMQPTQQEPQKTPVLPF